jgi:parallel beta-helix repeat protein
MYQERNVLTRHDCHFGSDSSVVPSISPGRAWPLRALRRTTDRAVAPQASARHAPALALLALAGQLGCAMLLVAGAPRPALAQHAATAVAVAVNTVTATPSAVQVGQTVKFATTVTSTSKVTGYTIGLQVFLNNAYVQSGSQLFSGLTLLPNTPVSEQSSWSIPAGTAPGTYEILAGVFDSKWNWITGASTTFVVSPASSGGSGGGSGGSGGGSGGSGGTSGAGVNTPGLSAALSAAPPYTCTTNFYVDGVNGNDANPGTQALPWKTIGNADNGYPNVPTPGECVNVLPGTYSLSRTMVLSHGGNINTLTGYVVYRSTKPQAAHIIAASNIGDLIMLWAPYIVLDGFEIDGNKAVTSGSGVNGCANGGGPGNIAHHFVAVNNIIHDMGGAGLSTCTADFITWSHNVVYNTSSTSRYEMSGLDVWEPKALAAGSYTPTSADKAPFGIVLSYNTVYGNGEGAAIPYPHTDGNGIIIDTTFGSASCQTCGTPYPGQILVLGNLAYNNGGGGIHVFLSKNVTVANNTAYNNYLDTQNPGQARGDLSNGGSQNITWINNIGYAVPGSGVLANNEPIITFPVTNFPDSGTWSNNIAYGAPVTSDSRSPVSAASNMLGVNPDLTAPASGNFVPLAGSPAIGAGLSESYLPWTPPAIGAYTPGSGGTAAVAAVVQTATAAPAASGSVTCRVSALPSRQVLQPCAATR